MYDYVIKNGAVFDPAGGIAGDKRWIGIDGAFVSAVSESPLEGAYTIDAEGCYVTPGLIDFHTHLFSKGSEYGIKPDYLLSQCVTAAVDAGTSGSVGFESFYSADIVPSSLDIRAFVSLGATGLGDPKHRQNYARERINVKKLKKLKKRLKAPVGRVAASELCVDKAVN